MTIEDVEAPSDAGAASPSANDVTSRWIRRWLARWRPILVMVSLITAMGLAASLFNFQYRPDQQTDDAAAHQAIKAASDGAVALLSYSPGNLNRDFATAKSHLTGDFLAYYNKFTEQIVTPAAQQRQITTTASAVRAAVSQLHPDSAVVLVFINQSTASKDKPEPVITASSVLVTLTKVKGSWLIAKFDPV